MRAKVNLQPEFDYQPSNLKLIQEYYWKYEEISRILDDNPKILDLAHRDLKDPLKYATVKDRDGSTFRYTSDTVLRLLICEIVEGTSLRQTIIRVEDSNRLRWFVRIYNGPMMDFTTLNKLKNSIRPETWEKINKALTGYAAAGDLISGDKLRTDTTAVETNIHWPTDSSLLWDTYRVLARLIERAREIDPHAAGNGRLLKRKAKRLQQKISRQVAKKGTKASKLKPLYEKLIGLVERICAWALKVSQALERRLWNYDTSDQARAAAIIKQIAEYRKLGQQVLDQTRRRVLQGEQVPNEEKIFSIFEPHTELLKRGKAGKDIEFGHMIQIQQVAEKFITDYAVFKKRPVEHLLIEPTIEEHKRLFGHYPQELAADKASYQPDVVERLRQKVDMVSIAKRGKRTQQETEREHDPAFRHAQRFRAGVEGTISFLKRILYLARCYSKGWTHYVSTVGATVFAHNLLILARC